MPATPAATRVVTARSRPRTRPCTVLQSEVPLLKKSRAAASATRLTFALPTTAVSGPVSVVGTFNDWTPGTHVLRRRSNGTSSVTVTVPTGTAVTFRYLGEHGRWFDDDTADEITTEGSLVLA